MQEYKTEAIVWFSRKKVTFYLKEGFDLSWENLVDIKIDEEAAYKNTWVRLPDDLIKIIRVSHNET
jgi:hypothetical protein